MNRLAFILVFVATTHLQGVQLPREATCAELLADESLTHFVLTNVSGIRNFPGHYALAAQQIMLTLIEHFGHRNLDFTYFERLFRQYQIPLYLVANSQALCPGLTIGYPPPLAKIKDQAEPLYHLWVGVKGSFEAQALLEELGITEQENLERLQRTGFILAETEESLKDNENIEVADPQTLDRLRTVRARRPFNPEDN